MTWHFMWQRPRLKNHLEAPLKANLGINPGRNAPLIKSNDNLVRALSHVTKKTFNGIGRANIAMHHRWEGIKGEQMLFIFTETTKRFWIALLVFDFESR